MSQWRDLNSWPLPYQGNALPLSYIGSAGRLTWPCRAGDRVRTGDIQLGRLTLYQLSYSRVNKFFNCGESRIRTCEGKNQQIYSLSSLAAWVSPQNVNDLIYLSRWRDSNPRPADYKSAALASWATSAKTALKRFANVSNYFFLFKAFLIHKLFIKSKLFLFGVLTSVQ